MWTEVEAELGRRFIVIGNSTQGSGDTHQRRSINRRHEDEQKLATTNIIDFLHQRKVCVELANHKSKVIKLDLRMTTMQIKKSDQNIIEQKLTSVSEKLKKWTQHSGVSTLHRPNEARTLGSTLTRYDLPTGNNCFRYR